jgi:hypothetical protein
LLIFRHRSIRGASGPGTREQSELSCFPCPPFASLFLALIRSGYQRPAREEADQRVHNHHGDFPVAAIMHLAQSMMAVWSGCGASAGSPKRQRGQRGWPVYQFARADAAADVLKLVSSALAVSCEDGGRKEHYRVSVMGKPLTISRADIWKCFCSGTPVRAGAAAGGRS